MKIVHINPKCEVTPSEILGRYHPFGLPIGKVNSVESVLVESAQKTWQFKWSQKTLEYYPEIEIENHIILHYINDRITFNHKGVKIIAHPAFKLPFFSNDVDFFSPSFLESMKRLNNCLVHNHRPQYLYSYFINKYFTEIPLILDDSGGATPNFSSFYEIPSFKMKFLRFFEDGFFRNVDFIRCASREFLKYANSIYNIQGDIWGPGVEDHFFNIEKKINNNRISILYVGSFYRYKGVDIILDAFEKLKKDYNISLTCVGGSPSDELYEKVNEKATRTVDRIPQEELLDFFREANIYVMPGIKTLEICGIGGAVLEALATNTPVISKNLKDFRNKEFIHKLGIIPKSNEDFCNSLETMIKSIANFSNTRKYVKSEYSWRSVINQLVSEYKYVWNKYYAE